MKETDVQSPDYYHKVVNCQYACPAHTPVPEYIRLIAQRRYTDAYLINWESNVFPGILGRVCDRPCEPACRRVRVEETPVAICRLKRAAADNKGDISPYLPEVPSAKNGKRVALIGAGPASLTVARDLLPQGYEVTLFDREHKAGGMVRSQIPGFRLPESVLDEEVDRILDMGVDTRFGQDITSLKAVLDEAFDAVFVGTGAPSGRDLDLPGRGEAGDKVQVGINWLAGVAFDHISSADKRVIVLGGGNTAMDCCRTALRLGGKDVKVVVRSSYQDMKASPWEKDDAQAEGVEFINHRVPKEYVVENGKLTGMRFEVVKSVYDENGRRSLVPTGDDPVFIPCDQVLVAIGQDAQFPWIERDLGIDFDKWDMPVLDKTSLQSTNPKVFFGGDAAFGPENIITAVAHGHQAAVSIDLFCQGQDAVADRPAETYNLVSQKMGVHEWSYHNTISNELRQAVPHMDLRKALKEPKAEVELGFDEELALAEAARCLNCDVQTVFSAKRCIECDACVDICPMDCINFTHNGEEEDLRSRLRVPAIESEDPLYVSADLKTGQVMVKDEDVCLHCGLCAERCPTGAWDMQKFILNQAQGV
ncbi:FAD-dependent oxidoreductase [Motiliproteus sp. SC1-56]|uniref:FAD-dependent oxidoreductase n=1 Tax=Motiliproteus sp. SC1-56 TaxID=2799565 RepID=UPI001A8DE81C|nr:FAD-dependent oxidoreductase [Motiliproteus sp. SC1-56]